MSILQVSAAVLKKSDGGLPEPSGCTRSLARDSTLTHPPEPILCLETAKRKVRYLIVKCAMTSKETGLGPGLIWQLGGAPSPAPVNSKESGSKPGRVKPHRSSASTAQCFLTVLETTWHLLPSVPLAGPASVLSIMAREGGLGLLVFCMVLGKAFDITGMLPPCSLNLFSKLQMVM